MRYLKEIVSKNKACIVFYLGIGICNSFLLNYKAEYFQRVIDGLADGSATLAGIWMYGAILLLDYCMNYVEEYPGKKLEQGIFLDFKLLSLRKISRIDYQAYETIGTGKLTQRIENGSEAGRNVLYGFWFCVIRQLIPTICFSVCFIWRISREVTYVILLGYGIIFLITNLLLKALYQFKERILANEEAMNHYLVRGFMELVVFRMERQFPKEIKKASNARDVIVNSQVRMNLIHEAFFTFFALLVAVLDLGILLYAWKSSALSVGSVVALLSLLENAYTPIAIFNVKYVQYKLDLASFQRFEEFLKMKEDEQLESGTRVSSLSGGIEVCNLSFSYGEREVFHNLNLSIKQAEKVAFVGESGSGKSTLIKVITGLLKYESGSIQLDGKELKELCLTTVYDHISYLSQDTPVFDGSLRENLVFGGDIDDSTINQVLEKVHLSSLTGSMSEGLDTSVGEKGMILSGGEKQRLALARLWFEKKQIVILDEATSAMDNLTEEAVMEEVMKAMKHKTVIAIAHRLSSVRNFDRIVVFHKGEIVGQGRFEELLENNQYFRKLYEASVSSTRMDS